jgi:hypothetical protein
MDTLERVARCLAENPGWSNHVVALELDISRAMAQRYGAEARNYLGIRSAKDQCSVYIDRRKYDEACRLLRVTPVEGDMVDKVAGMQTGRRISMRDPTGKRRLSAKPNPPKYDERVGTNGANELKRLLALLRAQMAKRDYCRVTITPDTVLVAQVVEFLLP